jgi:TolA-binding protein
MLSIRLSSAVALLALGVSACSSNKTISEGTPQQETRPVDSSMTQSAPPPALDTTAEPTIGEQLGRLDALMRTASGDSLVRLQEEYQRLLMRANGNTIQTGGMSQPTTAQTQPDGATASSTQLRGLRPSELRFAEGEDAGASTPATPRGTTTRTARPDAKTAARAIDRDDEVELPREQSKSAALAQRQKKLVDGLAAARAGNYPKAVEDLPHALSGPLTGTKRTEAQYSYALSLEKTGNLTKAAENYLKASSAGESLGHKSYISYCRVLARSGQRQRARQLLVEFIQKNPKSPQVVNARQLLQTI